MGKNKVDLDNVAPLTLPWTRDVWGGLRPPVSVEAAQLSAKMAEATYSMNVEDWLRAGWQDATILVDGELTPIKRNESWLSKQWRERRMHARLHQHGTLGEVLGTLRQVGESDTCKALVMAHPAPEGRWIVAVSFMGTGARLYDWVSNFRMTSQDGVHRGFLQLTRQFERFETSIVFPETARELGLRRLTLRQVLEEMQHPGSRFTLWLSGHSQGGALMQVYAHHKIHTDKVMARNIVGYGFASPSVMTGTAVENPAAYPLYHIHNSDDVVPRCGAQVHLGVCLTYPSDEALRARCYDWPQDTLSVRARACAKPILDQMTDTAACIESAVACLNVVSKGTATDVWNVLGLPGSSPLGRVAAAADVDGMLRSARRHLSMAYQSITGRQLDQERVAEFMAQIRAAAREVGLRAFGAALRQWMGAAHSMSSVLPGGRVGPYHDIVSNAMEQLIPSCWLAGDPPIRLPGAKRGSQTIRGEVEDTALIVRRRERVPRRPYRGLRHQDPRPRTDTRHRTAQAEPGTLRVGEKLVLVREQKT